MGDQKATEVAQAFHQYLLILHESLTARNWMTLGFPPPRDDVWVGAYLDDLAVILLGQKSDVSGLRPASSVEPLDQAILDSAHLAHSNAGTVLHKGKRTTREAEGVMWGGALSGPQQSVSGEVPSMHRLIVLTACHLIRGLSGYKMMAKLTSPGFTT